MSHHDQYHYELERQRREEIARQNAQKNVINAIARYRQSVQNMINEGLDKYISIENINMQINTI